jgi:hypothetical protein
MADQKNDLSKNINASAGQGATTPGSAGQSAGTTGSAGQSGTGLSQGQSGSVTGAATAAAKSFYDQAKETAGQAYEAVTDKAATKLDDKKGTLSDGLSTVADSIRQVGDNMSRGLVQGTNTDNALASAASKYSKTAATRIQDLAGYFERTDVRTMARDVEGYARRNPAIFIGAAFGLGMLAARFLKSSPSRSYYRGSNRQLATPGGSFDAGRNNFELRDEESGQGLQMGSQSFEPKNTATTGQTGTSSTSGTMGQNLGSTSTGTGSTATTPKKKSGGPSTKNTDSTRDSRTNPM